MQEIELTPEAIRKFKNRIAPLLESVTVKAHTRHSKKGKAFQVRQSTRNIQVVHMGEKFNLRPDLHPEAHVQMLRKIAVTQLNTAQRVKDRGLMGKVDKAGSHVWDYSAMHKKALSRGLAATDLMQYIDYTHGRKRAGPSKAVPTVGKELLAKTYASLVKTGST